MKRHNNPTHTTSPISTLNAILTTTSSDYNSSIPIFHFGGRVQEKKHMQKLHLIYLNAGDPIRRVLQNYVLRYPGHFKWSEPI
jgi:hypothetical protein